MRSGISTNNEFWFVISSWNRNQDTRNYTYMIFQLTIFTLYFAMIYATLYTINDSIPLYKV